MPSAATQDSVLEEEQTQFSFPDNYPCYAGENENTGKAGNSRGYVVSQESEYEPVRLGDLPTIQVRMLPLLVKTSAAWVALTESDLCDWAGLWINRVAAGWSSRSSIMQGSPSVNMEELLTLAKQEERAALALAALEQRGP